MQINTLRFGEIEVDINKIITFQQGVPGFEHLRTFIMLTPDVEMPFSFMQSLEDGDLSFIVTNPFLYYPDYDFELPLSVEQELNIQNEEEVMVFSIVSINEADEFTLNLLAPLILNTEARLGKQFILHNSPYKTKHPIHFNGNESADLTETTQTGEDGASC